MKRKALLFSVLVIGLLLGLTGCKDEKTVEISLPGGDYKGEQEVTLKASDGHSDIVYTLDGSDPMDKGNLYNPDMPLHLNSNVTLKARVQVRNDYGPIAEAQYKITPIEEKKLSVEQRFFLTNISGHYELNGKSYYIHRSEETIDWNNGKESGSSPIIDIQPNDSESGTLTYLDNGGKEVKLEIDMNPPGDNAVMFNGENFPYLGE